VSELTRSHKLVPILKQDRKIQKEMPRYTVEIALYDLSMGMAANLSGQLLGPDHAIPMIPHTAIIAYVREYFFSSGIQNMEPNMFRRSRGIQPVQIIAKGETTISREEFEQWCQSSSTRSLYNEFSYDLFRRNCNNFSDYALKNGLNFATGVPEWIIDLPRKVSSSPMGQMIMPMMSRMEAPFAQNGTSNLSQASYVPPVANISSPLKPVPNPWAHIPSDSNVKQVATSPVKSSKTYSVGTPFLNSQSSLLLSSDSKTIALCVNKLKQLTTNTKPCALERLQLDLVDSSPRINPITVKNALWSYIQYPLQTPSSAVVMALMLLRLVVLHPTNSSLEESHESILPSFIHLIASQLSLGNGEAIQIADDGSSNIFINNISARCMAWCTLSNSFVHHTSLFVKSLNLGNLTDQTAPTFKPNSNSNENYVSLEQIIDSAIKDLTSPRMELRQASSTFLHNLVQVVVQDTKSDKNTNVTNEDLSDWVVTILCACLDGLGDESDDITQFRKLLIIAKLLQKFGSPASSLVRDLGFDSLLECLRSDGNISKKETATLVSEVLDSFMV